MVLSLECLEVSVARLALVEPDEDAVPLRQRTEIDLAIVVDVGCDDGEDAVVKLEDLRSRIRKADDDVRVGRLREDDAIEEAITIEVGFDRCIGRCRQQAQRNRGVQSTSSNSSECLDPCSQWFRHNLTSASISEVGQALISRVLYL